jgi:hypothetical protein
MTERNLGKLVKTDKDQRSPVSPEKRKRIDPIEQAIEAALSPGSFISSGACQSTLAEKIG